MRALQRWLDAQTESGKRENPGNSQGIDTTARQIPGAPSEDCRASTPTRRRPESQAASDEMLGFADHEKRKVRRKLEVRDDDIVIALINGAREMRNVRRINADTVELWPSFHPTTAGVTPVEVGPTTGDAEIVEIVGRRIARTR